MSGIGWRWSRSLRRGATQLLQDAVATEEYIDRPAAQSVGGSPLTTTRCMKVQRARVVSWSRRRSGKTARFPILARPTAREQTPRAAAPSRRSPRAGCVRARGNPVVYMSQPTPDSLQTGRPPCCLAAGDVGDAGEARATDEETTAHWHRVGDVSSRGGARAETGQPKTQDPSHRHVVRLTGGDARRGDPEGRTAVCASSRSSAAGGRVAVYAVRLEHGRDAGLRVFADGSVGGGTYFVDRLEVAARLNQSRRGRHGRVNTRKAVPQADPSRRPPASPFAESSDDGAADVWRRSRWRRPRRKQGGPAALARGSPVDWRAVPRRYRHGRLTGDVD